MKWFCYWLSLPVLVAPVAIAPLVAVHAQGVENPLGHHDTTPLAAGPVRLIAALIPVEAGSEVKGSIRFGVAGEMLEVLGRIDGLDPNKRYRLCVALPAPTNLDPSDRVLGVGDGATASILARPARTDDALCVLLADASGGIEVKTTLKGIGLVDGDHTVLGRTLILTKISEDEGSGAPLRVASATVKVAGTGNEPVHASRLNELGPDERWF